MKGLFTGTLFLLLTSGIWAQKNINPITDRKIYGFVDSFFVSTDLNTLNRDTLIAFSGTPWINTGFRASIDQFNGYYYFLGSLPGHSGTFHIIDLVNLTIESRTGFSPVYKHYSRYLEYDFLRNRVMYDLVQSLRSVDLESNKHHQVVERKDKNFGIYGQACTYKVGSNDFLMLVSEMGGERKSSFLSMDGYSGNTRCEAEIETQNNVQLAPSALVHNLYSQKVYAHRNGTFGTASFCDGTVNWNGTVVDYKSHLNNQMAVLNHVNQTYIFPYLSTSSHEPYKIAIIDIVSDSVLRILNQPWDGKMELQQIYDKPQAPLYLQNDTLFVPKGLSYRWFLDGVFIGSSNDNFWVPTKTGHYSAKVKFREYTSTSTKVGIWNTSLPEGSDALTSMFPNPAINKVTVNTQSLSDGEILVFDDLGRVRIRQELDGALENIELEVSTLSPGAYSVVFISDQTTFRRGHFVKL